MVVEIHSDGHRAGQQASGEQQCLALQRMNFQVSAAGGKSINR